LPERLTCVGHRPPPALSSGPRPGAVTYPTLPASRRRPP